jgi:hypothetical protein
MIHLREIHYYHISINYKKIYYYNIKMSVYGKCKLISNQIASIYDPSGIKDIIKNWVADEWSVGFSVKGEKNDEFFVSTTGIYRYDLTMVGSYNGGTNDGIEFKLKDISGNIIDCGCSYNGNGNINIANISGILKVTDVSNGFKIHGFMHGERGTWLKDLEGYSCSFSLQLIN